MLERDGADTSLEALREFKRALVAALAPGASGLRPGLIRDCAVLLEECGARYLKLEYPGSEAGCAAISDAISVPWALLSAGVDHPTFIGQLRAARAAGASGFIAGRSIWKDAAG